MAEETTSRSVSIPGSVGLLGVLTIATLVVLGLWGFVDGYLLEGGDHLAPTIGVLVVIVLTTGVLAALGARSKEWLAGPYW